MLVIQSSSSSNWNEATKEVLLEALPQILVLQLERFVYDPDTDCINRNYRIRKPVRFEPELEILLGTVFLCLLTC